MTTSQLLEMLKIDLGISTNAYDTRLTALLEASAEAIAIEGITLGASVSDAQLQIMYASWLWRKRDSQEGMPRMLRWHLNNRLFSEKV